MKILNPPKVLDLTSTEFLEFLSLIDHTTAMQIIEGELDYDNLHQESPDEDGNNTSITISVAPTSKLFNLESRPIVRRYRRVHALNIVPISIDLQYPDIPFPEGVNLYEEFARIFGINILRDNVEIIIHRTEGSHDVVMEAIVGSDNLVAYGSATVYINVLPPTDKYHLKDVLSSTTSTSFDGVEEVVWKIERLVPNTKVSLAEALGIK